MSIGLALSGGGFRALVFHIGVLARLAEENQLENVTYISTVSGGSLAAGLIFAENNYAWPDSETYLQKILPRVKEQITTNGLKSPLLIRQLKRIFTVFDTRADDIAALLKEGWNINKSLHELPKNPRWMINATCFETGKNWRFERFRMGDYLFGYSYDTEFPLADAVASSAAFPGLIGPYKLDTRKHAWFEYIDKKDEMEAPEAHQTRKTRTITPQFEQVHLWDGGVYDNLGLEPLHSFMDGWPRTDFLIVSDASGIFKTQPYKSEVSALYRMATGIMKNQIRALQSRAVIERIVNHDDRGSYLRTGNYCEKILKDAWWERIENGEMSFDQIKQLCEGSLNKEQANYCGNLETDIDDMAPGDYDLLYQHGFEVANATMYAYNEDMFEFIKFEK